MATIRTSIHRSFPRRSHAALRLLILFVPNAHNGRVWVTRVRRNPVEPIPYELIERILRLRKQDLAKAAARRKRSS